MDFNIYGFNTLWEMEPFNCQRHSTHAKLRVSIPYGKWSLGPYRSPAPIPLVSIPYGKWSPATLDPNPGDPWEFQYPMGNGAKMEG